MYMIGQSTDGTSISPAGVGGRWNQCGIWWRQISSSSKSDAECQELPRATNDVYASLLSVLLSIYENEDHHHDQFLESGIRNQH